MLTPKPFLPLGDQVALLEQRGMDVGDRETAVRELGLRNYYRLSGYWYPYRRISQGRRSDEFVAGTSLADVLALHDFDARLRAATFTALADVELAVRTHVGHALGAVDPCAHLKPALLSQRARGQDYQRWLTRYNRQVNDSREDFVVHHRQHYQELPVWVAVEVLDWGALSWLYSFSPRGVQDDIASRHGLTAPQFESWLKSLNIIRNICAHHARLFNRVHALMPKLPRGASTINAMASTMNRTFGQLSLIQYLLSSYDVGDTQILPWVLAAFPTVKMLTMADLGAPAQWQRLQLWS